MNRNLSSLLFGFDGGVGFFPTGYTNPVDVFVSTSLMEWDWSLFINISSDGISESTWIDEAATNSPTHYWVAARSDVHSDTDGIPDSLEIYLYGTNPDQNDTDSDGDGMPDGAEANLTSSIATNGSGGVLVIVPQTGWYHATDPSLNLVFLGE